MKILFYAKSIADAHLAHALAVLMRDKLGVTQFAAVAYRESGEGRYLKEQTASLFSYVLSESEMYWRVIQNGWSVDKTVLARLESEFGIPTIWQFVTHDRWLSMQRRGYIFKYGSTYSREQLLAHVQIRFLMLEDLVDKFNPDVVVYAGRDVGPSSALILASVASARGVPLLVPKHTKIGSYLTITNTVFSQTPNIEQRYRALRSGATSSSRQLASHILDEFNCGGLAPSFMRRDGPAGNQQKSSGRKALKVFGAKIGGYYRKQRSGDPLYVSWLRRRYDEATIKLRKLRMDQASYFTSPVPSENYVFFPLHLEPELALLLYAPFYTNQLAIIQNLAQSLPHDTCLYVKEHPRAFGRRPAAYYKEVAAIPNVRLIASSVNGRDLVKGSEGVVTITGTAGLEAMLMGKPVITLGDVYYNLVSELVWHVHAYSEVPSLIKQFRAFSSDESIVLDFLSAVLDESIDIDIQRLAGRLISSPANQQHNDLELLQYADYLIQSIKTLRDPLPLSGKRLQIEAC